MRDQTASNAVMPPKLWEEPRDPYHRWIWRALDNTYVAGFKTHGEAIAYGDLHGYKP